jgi:hypothetical protein
MPSRTCHPILSILLKLTLLVFWLVACSPAESNLQVWIDHPLHGSSAPLGTPVEIVSHAFARQGVAEQVLMINGEANQRSPEDSGTTFSQARFEWLPPAEGDYALQVTLYDTAGQTSNSQIITLRVLGTLAPLPVSPLPPATATYTPVPGAPDLAIELVEAVVAGYKGSTPFCNTRVVYHNDGDAAVPSDFNIQFYFNGVPQLENTVAGGLAPGASAEITFVYQFEGMPYIGINLDSTDLIVESDESNNAFAEIRLCGSELTPTFTNTVVPPSVVPPSVTPVTPASDTQAPPAPSPMVPADGLELDCRASQNLVWLPVDDPSGIIGYELRLERRASPADQWKAAGAWDSINDKQQTVNVECGFIYRWSVRARDGAGNLSSWSAWSQFTVQLP